MFKTIKQIADEVKVPKQKVYRYIKSNHINEAHQKNGVMYYDDAVISIVKAAFVQETALSEAHHEVHQKRINDAVGDAVIDILKIELISKNKQIEELQKELTKEREHNREKDKQLLDALSKIADSQVALVSGQTADKQKALVEKMVEAKTIQEEAIEVEPQKKKWWKRK